MGFLSSAKKALSGPIGGAIGGKLLDIGESAANAAMSYEENAKLQQRAFDWEKEKLQNATQWHMADLEKAGINPILAAGTGLATGSTGGSVSFGSGHTDLSNFENAATAKKAQQAQEKLQTAEIGKAKAEEKAAEATAARLEAENATNAPRLKNEKEFYESKTGEIMHKIGLGTKEIAPAVSAIGGGLFGASLMRGFKLFKSAHSAAKAAKTGIQLNRKGQAIIKKGMTQDELYRLIPTYQRGQMLPPRRTLRTVGDSYKH